MMAISEVCIRRPVFAVMLIAAMVVVGSVAFTSLGVDRLPSVDLPTVSVRTTLPGASPEEVESQVSQIVEEAVNTVEGIDELRSISGQGQSVVIATFKLSRDIEAAAQDVRDRVASIARNLPNDAEPPVVSKFDNDSSPVLTLALSGELSIRELTEIADKVIRPRLERSSGVGQVSIVGGLERTVNIDVDAEKLAAFGIPITAVRDAIESQNIDVPGGNVTGTQREQVLRTMGRLLTPADFGNIIVAVVNGTPIHVRDIATVVDGTREQRSSARLNGVPAVSLEIRRQSGANSVAVIEGVKSELVQLAPVIPPGVTLEIIRDQSIYIHAALHEIEVHLIIGSILATLVVLAFMRSWRSTIIAGVAIPASIISTFGVMWAMDFTLNSVTMLALVLMVGIVIDDAIVVLESIYTLVEEKAMPPMEAAVQGTRQIALAVLATTLSLVVIFVPVSFMSSISGRFLFQFGVTAAVAVLVSLLVSFTLTPMMASRMLRLPKSNASSHVAASRRGFYSVLDRAYHRALLFGIRFKAVTIVLALLVMASAVPLYSMIPQNYLPSDIDEAEFSINVLGPEGVSFTAFDEALREVEAKVAEHPAVLTTLSSAGGSFLGQVNRGQIYVRITPHTERYLSFGRLWRELRAGQPLEAFRGNFTQSDVMQDLRQELRSFPDLRCSVRSFPAFNIGGGNFDIDIAIRGPELERLAEFTEELRDRSRDLGGLPDGDTTLKLNTPELRVIIDRERAADLGVSPRDIGTALRILVGGDDEVTLFRDEATNEDYDVQLRLADRDRADSTAFPRLLVPAAGEQRTVELRSFASIEPALTADRIDRLDRQRAANFRSSVGPGYAMADRIAAIRAEIETLSMPEGYSARVMGRGRELERTFGEFLAAFVLSVVFMYMILASNYESYLHPLTILLSLPLSVPFALLSLLIAGESLNLYSALGILVLFGVVKKNSILQVDHINQLHGRGMPLEEAVVQGCRDRLRPILMTTLALVGGMLPLALGSGPGAEERRAIAVVVIGGQLLSLTLTLIVIPVAHIVLNRLFERRRVQKATVPARG